MPRTTEDSAATRDDRRELEVVHGQDMPQHDRLLVAVWNCEQVPTGFRIVLRKIRKRPSGEVCCG
jgi:hypothetical protein